MVKLIFAFCLVSLKKKLGSSVKENFFAKDGRQNMSLYFSTYFLSCRLI